MGDSPFQFLKEERRSVGKPSLPGVFLAQWEHPAFDLFIIPFSHEPYYVLSCNLLLCLSKLEQYLDM